MADKQEKKNDIKIKEPTRWWVTLIMYAVEIGIATGLFFITLSIRDFFSADLDLITKYRYLSDAFTIPAITFIMIGFLILLAGQGAFDGVGYGIRRLGRALLPFLIKKDETYAEYLEKRKARQKGLQYLSFVIVGTIFLIPAIIFIILFYQVY